MNRKGIVANAGLSERNAGPTAYIVIGLMIAIVYFLLFVLASQVV